MIWPRRHGLDDRQVEGLREVPVTLVARRDRHDRARAVAHGHVVGDEDRELPAVDGVDGEPPGEQACLLLVLGAAVGVGLVFHLGPVGGHRLGRRGIPPGPHRVSARGPLGGGVVGQVVFGGQHHEGGAEQGVRTRGENLDPLAAGGLGEDDPGALGTPDPVALHRLDLVGPVQFAEVGKQPLGVGGDAQHPLAHVAFEHGVVPDLGAALVGDLLVCQHGAQPRAPVHGSVGQVCQAVRVDDPASLQLRQLVPGLTRGCGPGPIGELLDELVDVPGPACLLVEPGVEDLQEYPLRPAIELDIGGGHAAAGIVCQAQPPQLAAHDGDVLVGGDPRVLSRLHCVLLGG